MFGELGKTIPVREIIALLAVLQCLLAPAIVYETSFVSTDMAVGASDYFAFVLPCMLAYLIGIYWKRQLFTIQMDSSSLNKDKGLILFGIGIFAGFIPLGFFSYLLSLIKFIGVFYLLFSNSKYKYAALIVMMFISVYQSLSHAMFHEMLIWILFIFFIWNLKHKMNRTAIFISLIVGVGLFVFVQTVKPLLREQLWYQTSNLSKDEVIQGTLSTARVDDNVFSNAIVRLNEGWHISKVLNHIPDYANYGHGESYINSILSSIMPRFLMSNKAKAGGRENMLRYAGYTLQDGTSMDIGLVGEAYGNFGYGGIIVMFFIGLLFSKIINFIEKKAQTRPELLLWIPFIFFQVIKAETSSATVFNHLAKSSLLVWFLFSKYNSILPFGHLFKIKRKIDE
jgi:hypothetical protein